MLQEGSVRTGDGLNFSYEWKPMDRTEAASQSAMEAFGKQPNARAAARSNEKNAAAMQHGLVRLDVAGSERSIHET
jgi:hypothetical protein